MNKPCARITLDLQQASTPTFVAVKKSDIGREIRITLSDGGFPYEISADCYAVLTGTKPDGNILYNHCDIEGNTIVYTVTEQTTAAAGRMKAEVKLYGADDQLVTSATFRIIIDGTVYTDDKVESSPEFSALNQLMNQVLEIIRNHSDESISVSIVTELPKEDISTRTLYLVKDTEKPSNIYTEYLYVNGEWEIIGSQQLDLTGYIKTINGEGPDQNGDFKMAEIEVKNVQKTVTSVGGTITNIKGVSIEVTKQNPDGTLSMTAGTVWNGTDGVSPHIGFNGNWFVGEQDTGVSAGGNNSGGNVDQTSVEPAEDDMPKVFITGVKPTTKDDVLAEMQYISKTDSFHAYLEIKCQGTSSMSWPKKNFTVKLYSDEARETKLKKDFKDWNHPGNKFVLKANYIDHSHARNIVSARLWNEVVKSRSDYDSLPKEMRNSPRNGAVDGFPIKVYYNGTYEGVYTWNIGKEDWMWGMNEDNPCHVLLCAETNTDGVYRATPCNFRSLWSGVDETDWSVEVGTNSTALKTSLNNLIQFVMDNDGDAFRNGISNYLDIQSAIDYYIFQYEICGLDGLAKNMLLATYDLKVWHCGAYDMDSTFGLWWNGSKFVSATYACPEDYQEEFSLLWERIEANFLPELKARQAELRKTVLSYYNMVTHFERFMDIIGLDLYAEDLTIYTGIPSGSTNNIKQIRNYIRDRQKYVDAEFAAMSAPVPCTGIALNTNTLTFTAEGSQALTATVTPDGCTDPVTWESDNISVATVNGGVVTAIANGSATITVKCGEYSASCSVAVSGIAEPVPCTGITLDKTKLTFDGEGTQFITATVTPSDTTDSVVGVSSAPAVASITVEGNVCTVKSVYNGNATIIVTCGEYSASCNVSVGGFAVNILNGVKWRYNSFNANTGVEYTNNGEITTEAVAVSEYAGKNIVLKTNDKGGKVGFWDASGSYISGFYSTSADIQDSTVPTNAATMRISVNAESKEVSVYFYGMDENLLDSANEITGKYYDFGTGTVQTESGVKCKKVALKRTGTLLIKNIVSGAFFDGNDSFIDGITYSAAASARFYGITENMASAGLNYRNTDAYAMILEDVKDSGTSIIEIT